MNNYPPPMNARSPESAGSLATARTRGQGVEHAHSRPSIIKRNSNATMDCAPCPHCEESKGYPIPKDGNYPESAWGHYLPGDEPGSRCALSGDRIPEIFGVPLEDCPRLKPMDCACASCGSDLWWDTEDQEYRCPSCGVCTGPEEED